MSSMLDSAPNSRVCPRSRVDTVRRSIKAEHLPDEIPLEWTIAALDAAGVRQALLTAWWGPKGPLLSNDDVAPGADAIQSDCLVLRA